MSILGNTLNVNYMLENIGIKTSISIKGIILEYNNDKFIITLHQYYPIKHTIIENKLIDTNKINQSSWNELLTIKNPDELELNCEIIKHIRTTMPSNNTSLYCDDEELIVNNYCYNNINYLPLYPRLLYIKAQGTKMHSPGSPVFQKSNKKLVGIISETYCENTNNYQIHIIPTYYIIKTLEKKCNNQIYKINEREIAKINKYNVKDGTVYHNNLLISLPLDVYFALEGDIDKTIIINGNQEHRYNELETIITNERYLLKNENSYVVNATLLILLKVIDKSIANEFRSFIRSNLGLDKKFLLNVCDGISDGISDDKKINKILNVNDLSYTFTLTIE